MPAWRTCSSGCRSRLRSSALLECKGAVGDVLRCVLAYERGDIDKARHRSLTGVPVGDLYLEALAWATDASSGLRPSAVAR